MWLDMWLGINWKKYRKHHHQYMPASAITEYEISILHDYSRTWTEQRDLYHNFFSLTKAVCRRHLDVSHQMSLPLCGRPVIKLWSTIRIHSFAIAWTVNLTVTERDEENYETEKQSTCMLIRTQYLRH